MRPNSDSIAARTTFKIGQVNNTFLECSSAHRCKWDGKHEKFDTIVVRRSNHDAPKNIRVSNNNLKRERVSERKRQQAPFTQSKPIGPTQRWLVEMINNL